MRHSPESTPHVENIPDNELHRAAAEQIKKAISSMVGQKIEKLVESNTMKQDLEQAADRVFTMAAKGSSEEEIEAALKQISLSLALKAVKPSE